MSVYISVTWSQKLYFGGHGDNFAGVKPAKGCQKCDFVTETPTNLVYNQDK